MSPSRPPLKRRSDDDLSQAMGFPILSFVWFLGIGYFWAIIDRNGQAWHDKIASTVVVRVR